MKLNQAQAAIYELNRITSDMKALNEQIGALCELSTPTSGEKEVYGTVVGRAVSVPIEIAINLLTRELDNSRKAYNDLAAQLNIEVI